MSGAWNTSTVAIWRMTCFNRFAACRRPAIRCGRRSRNCWTSPRKCRAGEGTVVEIVDFGSFVRLGPLDGLVHVSQICDDYISYEQVGNRFIGKETGKILEVNDQVRAKIIAVSLGTGRSGKLGLTMRQKFLGKEAWVEADIEDDIAEKEGKKAEPSEEEDSEDQN